MEGDDEGKAMGINVRMSAMPGPWGEIWVASTEQGICGISLRGERERLIRDLDGRREGCIFLDDPRSHKDAIRQIREYLQGRRRRFDLSLDLWGSLFQRRVWDALLEVPYGETRSYKDVALRVGVPKGVRAVGQANGRNPVPLIVPCHRIIRSSGALGGYGGGLDIKRDLLALESSEP